MPEPKFIVALGRVAGRNLTWVLFSTNFSLKSSHRRFKAVEKKKSKSILFPAEALQLLDRLFILHVRKSYGLAAAETARRSPPATGSQTQRRGFSSERPETVPNSPATPEPLPQAVCNPNQITSDFGPSAGNSIIFLPLRDGRWQVEGKEEEGVKN